MPFCSNCGKENNNGEKFCPECGTAMSNINITQNTQRKQIYDGEIHKCPSCGEVLKSFEISCPSCGYELRGTEAVGSVQRFYHDLNNAATSEKKIMLIKNFPIPNTKEDIFEFMILASTNIAGEQQKKVFDAWRVKFEQSYEKAKLVIINQNDFTKIKEIYDRTNKTIGKEKLVRNAKAVGNAVSRSGSIPKLLMLIGKSAAVIAGIVLFIVSINIERSGGNASMHELIGVVLLVASALTLAIRKAPFIEILIGAISGFLSFYLAEFLHNGSLLQLGGAIVLIVVAISFFKKLAKKEDK